MMFFNLFLIALNFASMYATYRFMKTMMSWMNRNGQEIMKLYKHVDHCMTVQNQQTLVVDRLITIVRDDRNSREFH